MSEPEGLSRIEWQEKLDLLGGALRELGTPMQLEIIGSWPLIDAGMPGRATLDIDVWAPASEFDRSGLRKACAAAGLVFDPLDELDTPYLQIVQPGIVSIPEHVPLKLGQWGALTLFVPPPAALAAAKLTRAQPKDIADVLFLRAKYRLGRADVSAFVEGISDRAHRETARENLVYFD
jgi:hypothetical protein